ncbi:hypothetical protein NQ317_010426 [Molorchus minor]|uniref:ubiquitinyl hydrolase 1 n=1 Tax=Molorchus minor TaxID=1323400 RepID=A0ABQ9JZW9_9CUCU|nr:hypothetical protein NQ317_010426 [Molorchus minor]
MKKGNHEDTFEFFMFLFSQLSEDCSFELPRPQIMTEREKSWYSQLGGRSSYFIDLMHYQLKNTKVCWRCQKPNYTFDNDNTLMLPIPEKRENCNLEYMLKEYMKENLVVDYSCVECKTVVTIVNIKDIVQDPAILIILLKRYMVIGDGSYKKDEANISFPINDLHFGNSIYKLYAIPQHSGSMVAGHYYARFY